LVTRVDKVPFDPVLGAKIFGEIQAEGLRAAGALVERLVHLVDGPHPGTSEETTETTSGGESGSSPVDLGAVLPWFELWRELAERTSDTLQRFQGAGGGPGGEGVRVGVDGSLVPAHPLIVVVGREGRGQGDMWLHNGTADDHGELVPQCGPLCDADGTALDCEVNVDPPRVDGLPPRSSRGFTIAVSVGGPAAPGTYRGVVQVRGADAVWMPIEVTVEAST
jgi:hypothetical protein